jgi:uncharacterized protein (UPF0261 family)
MSIYLLATLDTKGPEAAFLRDCLRAVSIDVTVVDCGCLGEPLIEPKITREAVFQAAGATHAQILAENDRGQAVTKAAAGAAEIVEQAWRKGRLSGVLALGGSAGTTIGTTAMRRLPIGVPKIVVSTLASGQVRQYVGDKDILMLNSVVDIAGINSISRRILENAASAMAGMILYRPQQHQASDRPIVAASMFGVTTPCVQHARQLLEEAGYEVLIFHATGNGGCAMESLIRDGLILGVLDLTTTELADELVGGVLSAGPGRLTAASEMGVPQVISVGATDMVNFGPPETVPAQFQQRVFYEHNPTVTLMRTTPSECRQLGQLIALKAARAKGPVSLLLPLRGVSAIDAEGQAFDDPTAREALFEAIRAHRGDLELVEIDRHINDEAFAEAAANKLLELIKQAQESADDSIPAG